MNTRLLRYLLFAAFFLSTGCANQTTPPGGKKDITPPKLLKATPSDSMRNSRTKRIELTFDEYITINDPIKEVQISPLLAIQPVVTNNGKKVIIKIIDSLLEENTTYRLSLGSAVRDLHESNVFAGYSYTFSTGAYFDSLQLNGRVTNAATGLPDTSGILVGLYAGNEGDSAIVRHKPKYITRPDASGYFIFRGLPDKKFRIYALKDANDNLIYDGPGEMIAFSDQLARPGDTTAKISLRLFAQKDTSSNKGIDSVRNGRPGARQPAAKDGFTYTVNVDTANLSKRTFDINKHLSIVFSRIPAINKDKITLVYDSVGVSVPVKLAFNTDTLHPSVLSLNNSWLENTAYTLRLAKGFAKDTSGKDLLPAKYNFRTKEDEDYGKITVHLPSKYNSPDHLLMVVAENDTVYQKPVTDTIVNLARLAPARYTFRVIADKNRNGKWDSGNLFGKKQPEEVIPYREPFTLKAGWENIIDFEPIPVPQRSAERPGAKK